MIRKHWNFRYVWNKICYVVLSRKNKSAPWICLKAIDYLDKNLNLSMHVFEWGSGRSTIWFSQRCASVISVEHDIVWSRKVSEDIMAGNVENVTYKIASDSTDYEESIDSYPDSSFDLIVIDGIRRDCCFKKALKKVKLGGIILLDDAQRYVPSNSKAPNSFSKWENNPFPEWRELEGVFINFSQDWFHDGISDCLIIRKLTL